MLNFLIFLYVCAFKISCSIELSMKKFYNLGARFCNFYVFYIQKFRWLDKTSLLILENKSTNSKRLLVNSERRFLEAMDTSKKKRK